MVSYLSRAPAGIRDDSGKKADLDYRTLNTSARNCCEWAYEMVEATGFRAPSSGSVRKNF